MRHSRKQPLVQNAALAGLPAMAADIGGLLAAEAVAPDVIVGHSVGAAIALRRALDLPRPPEAVVAINGALGNFRRLSSDVSSRLALMAASTPLPAVGFSWIASSHALVRLMISVTGDRLDHRGVKHCRRLVSGRGPLAATVAMMARWDVAPLLDDLPNVRSRALFLVGDADLAVPLEASRAAARRMAGSRIESFRGLGPLLHEERPAAAAGAIRSFAAEAQTRRAG